MSPSAEPTRQPTSVWNAANFLTGLRILMVPLFAYLLMRHSGQSDTDRIAAALVFVLASLTDSLDGELARRRGLITDFGKIADPIADKALTGTAMVCLSLLGEVPWWATALVLVRELGITAIRLRLLNRMVLPAGRGGKAKTIVQSAAITAFILPLTGWLHQIAVVLMVVAVALTVITGVDYLVKIRQQIREQRDA